MSQNEIYGIVAVAWVLCSLLALRLWFNRFGTLPVWVYFLALLGGPVAFVGWLIGECIVSQRERNR
jgi:hypothetical protein